MNYTIEKNIIQGLRMGEDAAFEHLRKTCYKSVAYIAESTSGSKEDAEDLYYEGIEILLQKINKPNFVITSKVRTLLIKICRRTNKDKLRKQKSRQNYMNEQSDDSYEENFEEKIDRKVFQGILWHSFEKLKADCQSLMKKVLENVPLNIIAQEMGLAAGSVRNKKKNCLIALTCIINDHPDYAKMKQNDEIFLD